MKRKLLSSVATIFTALTLMAQLPVSQTAENKNVVLEEYTGIYCTFCPDGHSRANAIKAANPNDVVLVNIHAGGFAVPDPGDPDFRTPFGQVLADQTGLTGYPSGTINRTVYEGSVTALSRVDWSKYADTVLSKPSYANIALEASLDVQTREITVDVEVYYTGAGSATNKLNVAILQNGVEGPQTGMNANPDQILPNGNYEHNHMLRHFITGQFGDDITTTTMGTLVQRQYVYAIPADLNGVDYELGNLEIVAYLAEGNQTVITGAEGPIDFVLPPGSTLVDLASATSMQSPNDYCNGSVTPEITVSNVDANSVSSYEVSYTINGGTPVTQVVSTALNGGASATATFPNITLPVGENKIEYSVNVINGSNDVELVTGNNKSVSDVIYIMPSSTFGNIHEEDFEGLALGTPAPANAISDNPDGISAFVVDNDINNSVNQEIGGFGNSSSSYRWDFYNIQSGSSKIVFEKLDFTTGSSYGLKFSHAYAQYTTENDKLEVLVSFDCGASWTSVYSKQGAALATAPANGTDRFYPAVTEWVKDSVDLSAYATFPEVMIAFEGTSAFGNDLYIDDIQILNEVALSVDEKTLLSEVSIYPNPSNGTSNLEVNLNENSLVNVIVYNSLGEVVVDGFSRNLNAGTSVLNLNLENLNNGMYFAHVNIAGETVVKQITLLK